MCVVSMVGDHYHEKWPKEYPWVQPIINPPDPSGPYWPDYFPNPKEQVSKEEFDKLKKDVEECLKLLKRAKKYDEDNHEPDCEIEEKMETVRKVADIVGVDVSEVLGKR